MASGIKVNLKGFEKMLEDLQTAGGNVDKAAKRAVDEGAKIVEQELKSACASAGVPASVSSEITTEIEGNGNRYSAKVGWKLGDYNPDNLSAGYKAVFLNYGTGKRQANRDKVHANIGGQWETLGRNRGQMQPRGFIARAKQNSGKKMRKVQQQILEEALKELS